MYNHGTSTVTAELYTLQDNDSLTIEPTAPYVLRFRYLPAELKPLEKMLKMGVKNLYTAEMMTIVLGDGAPKEDVLAMSQRILKEYGQKIIIHESNPLTLAEAPGNPLN